MKIGQIVYVCECDLIEEDEADWPGHDPAGCVVKCVVAPVGEELRAIHLPIRAWNMGDKPPVINCDAMGRAGATIADAWRVAADWDEQEAKKLLRVAGLFRVRADELEAEPCVESGSAPTPAPATRSCGI